MGQQTAKKTSTVQVLVTSDQKDKIARLARARRVSESDLFQDAVAEAVEEFDHSRRALAG